MLILLWEFQHQTLLPRRSKTEGWSLGLNITQAYILSYRIVVEVTAKPKVDIEISGIKEDAAIAIRTCMAPKSQ